MYSTSFFAISSLFFSPMLNFMILHIVASVRLLRLNRLIQSCNCNPRSRQFIFTCRDDNYKEWFCDGRASVHRAITLHYDVFLLPDHFFSHACKMNWHTRKKRPHFFNLLPFPAQPLTPFSTFLSLPPLCDMNVLSFLSRDLQDDDIHLFCTNFWHARANGEMWSVQFLPTFEPRNATA